MEDLEGAPGSPALQSDEEPQGLNDPRDPLNPGMEEESRPNAPLGDPTADVDAFEDEEAPETVEAMEEAEEEMAAGGDDSDAESELEELDETQFQDFDPSALEIPDKPVAVDESNVNLLGVHKRKRTEEEEQERRKKRKEKGSRRDKPKRDKKRRDADGEDVDFEGGEEIDGKRARKSKLGPDGRPLKSARRARSPVEEENEENLSPEERRRRALDRKMDAAVASNRPRGRRRGGIDLEALADTEIAEMRNKMTTACQQDRAARDAGRIATHKIGILPQVVELMNRNTIQAQLVDPDLNILEAVRFMLEPADQDAALPNYQIQKELFSILMRLQMTKDALVASRIGSVVLFYTKSSQPQPEIKRMAEKLVGEWMRIVLKKHKTMKHAPIETKIYDPLRSSQGGVKAASQAEVAAERRRKVLEQPVPGNRARVEGGVGTYTIAPVSSVINTSGLNRKVGAGGENAFRKIAQRSAANQAKR